MAGRVRELGIRGAYVGSGTFSSVYVGKDVLGVRRAVKRARGADHAGLAREALFLRELRRAPCVVGLVRVCVDESDATCLVLDAGSVAMDDWLGAARRKRGSWMTRARRFTADVAVGLAHCHARGVVHRDIKPSNVVLRNGRAMIVDFGSAETAGVACDMRVGALLYRAPETALGERTCHPAVDVFALGLMFHETRGERVPGLVDSEYAQLIRVLRAFGACGAWASAMPDFSPDFPKFTRRMRVDPIVGACCAVNPAARATAESVVAFLGARAEFDELDAETRSEALAVAGAGHGALVAYLVAATHRVTPRECMRVAHAARALARGTDDEPDAVRWLVRAIC